MFQVWEEPTLESIGVVRKNHRSFKLFFARMIQDVEFRMFYNSMYDSMRLTYSRMCMSLLRMCSRQSRIK